MVARTIACICTRYISPDAAAIERAWYTGNRNPFRFPQTEIFPRYQGPFIRAERDVAEPQREAVVGQRGLIPWFAKTPKLSYATSNARSEKLSDKASYKRPWARGRRCIIPAVSYEYMHHLLVVQDFCRIPDRHSFFGRY